MNDKKTSVPLWVWIGLGAIVAILVVWALFVIFAADMTSVSPAGETPAVIEPTAFTEEEITEVKMEAVTARDEALCEKIADEAERNFCLTMVFRDKAVDTGDVEMCKRIPDDSWRESCIRIIESGM